MKDVDWCLFVIDDIVDWGRNVARFSDRVNQHAASVFGWCISEG